MGMRNGELWHGEGRQRRKWKRKRNRGAEGGAEGERGCVKVSEMAGDAGDAAVSYFPGFAEVDEAGDAPDAAVESPPTATLCIGLMLTGAACCTPGSKRARNS